jgi:hypothetical protein
MNSIVEKHFKLLDLTLALREQLFDMLSDSDLGYFPGGGNPTLGQVLRSMGVMQSSYSNSFRAFRLDTSQQDTLPAVETSVTRLRGWFKSLDADLKEALEGLSEDDIQNRKVDRSGWEISVTYQFHIFREALLIFYGKISVYLKALGKTYPEQWEEWID